MGMFRSRSRHFGSYGEGKKLTKNWIEFYSEENPLIFSERGYTIVDQGVTQSYPSLMARWPIHFYGNVFYEMPATPT